MQTPHPLTRSAAWFVAALALLTGCARTTAPKVLYDGPVRSPEHVAVLKVPYTAALVRVDDRDAGGDNLFTLDRESVYHLPPGAHTLVLRYHELWPIERDDSHRTLRSDEVALRTTLEGGRVYAVTHPTHTTLAEAEAFADNPAFALTVRDRQDTPPAQRSVPVPPPPTPPTRTVTPVEASPAAPGDGAALESLKEQWRGADKNTRAAFLQWIVAE